jgi:site-specific DNA recombinase
MIPVVLYARVSTREQEREGYSIPAQRKLLAEYARVHGFQIDCEYVAVESAKNPGRVNAGSVPEQVCIRNRGVRLATI